MLGIENHYATWLETMYSHFGNKWLCLFRGPMWQYEEEDIPSTCSSDSTQSTQDLNMLDKSVIEDALIQSDINLDCIDNVCDDDDDVVSELSALQIQINTTTRESDQESMQGINQEINKVPRLWSNLSSEQEREVQQSLASPEEIELLHQVRPTASVSKRRNPNIYNALKVIYFFAIIDNSLLYW